MTSIKDEIITFFKKHDDDYFSAEWLSDYFNIPLEVIGDFIIMLEDLEIITCLSIKINLNYKCLWKYNS